jgi:DNA-binding response OmpR family regulator
MTSDLILIVEDEPAVARGLEFGLREEGFHVIWAKTGEQALNFTRSHDIKLILLDIRFPDISGFDVCRQIRTEGNRMPILMLTAKDEELDKVLGLELGADDYVVKPYSLRELISRIRAHLRRAYGELADATSGAIIQFDSVDIDLERLDVRKEGKSIFLTPTEFRLLRYLVSHPNIPIKRRDLIEAIWGYSNDIGSDRTVDVHIRHVREKLEVDPANPRWIVTVRGFGYKFQS